MFTADGTHLLNCKEKVEIVGQGTGDLKDYLDELRSSNTNKFVSGMSAKARAYDESLLEGYSAEFAVPDVSINFAIEVETLLCY